jgi:dipeptidyl aminopeptidase/acylaminoacyl peptidase
MLPTGEDIRCRHRRPVLLYAHGTQPNQNFDIGEIEDIEDNDEGTAAAAVFAAQGYVVVAPNYAGYDTPTLTYHGYLNADQQSKDMIDGLVAAHRAMPRAFGPDIRSLGNLFIAGFSQGGYVAMATHRALQALGIPVTASVSMSGTYARAAYVAQGASDGGTLAVLESYHVQLEAPYCFSAAHLFFEQHRHSLHS